MELSRNRIDDAPELDVHSSRFVTVTASRVCASAWANVHHTLVSVWRDGDGFESSSRMLSSNLYCGSASVNAAGGGDRSQSIDDTIVQ